jgi:error-prone DNA polymerase
VKGLSAATGQAIERERKNRPFTSIEDLHQRVPELRKDEMRKLAAVGALNFIDGAKSPKSKVQSPTSTTKEETWDIGPWTLDKGITRRDALWQIERVVRPAGPLYEELHEKGNSPLTPMTLPERLNADFRGTGLTIGRHPVAHHRAELDQKGCVRAIDLPSLRNGVRVRVAGWVIVRQRPGTAKGFVFLTLEDETGVANVIVTPNLFDKNRLVLVDEPFLLIEGILQHQDNVISVKARKVQALSFTVAAAASHDFH